MMDLEGGVYANRAKVRLLLRNLRFYFWVVLEGRRRDLC